MRRFGLRDVTLYILLGLLIFFTITSLQQMDRTDSPTYSQIRTLFMQERVEYFTLEDNTLTLTLRGQNGEKSAPSTGWLTPLFSTPTCGSSLTSSSPPAFWLGTTTPLV